MRSWTAMGGSLCLRAVLLLVLVVRPGTLGCRLPDIGKGNKTCSDASCATLQGMYSDPLKQSFLCGTGNNNCKGGTNYEHIRHLVPDSKLDSTRYVYGFLAQVKADKVADCCKACASTPNCMVFRHFPQNEDDYFPITMPTGKLPVAYYPPFPDCTKQPLCGQYQQYKDYPVLPAGETAVRNCVLFSMASIVTKDRQGNVCTGSISDNCYPQFSSVTGGFSIADPGPSGTNINYSNYTLNIAGVGLTGRPRSYLGGGCNPNVNGSVINDPHFVGADGIRFDFNGEIDKSFCLISDRALHVNIVLGGYYDSRTTGATVDASGKVIRSWITALAFLWRDASGVKRTLFLEARKGLDGSRSGGFISAVQADGQPVAILTEVGEQLEHAGAVLSFQQKAHQGLMDLDLFSLSITDVFNGTLSLRAAHPLLRTPTEAYVHFNLQVKDLRASTAVHGLLGQTFRRDSARIYKVLEYKVLASLLREPLQADGANGAGYLEGDVQDYKTTGATETDCRFCTAFA